MKKPCEIRGHLVSFLFMEMAGRQACYLGKTAKDIKLQPASSPAGYLKLLYELENPDEKNIKGFDLYLTIDTKLNRNSHRGQLYKNIQGVKYPLILSERGAMLVNNYLEDLFRISFVFFIDGFTHNGRKIDAINAFIDKYSLLEFGFSYESLRMLYYREKQKGRNLARMQYHIGNRVLDY